MEEEPNSENRITKARRFSYRIVKKLGRGKEISRSGKRSYKKTV